MVMYKCKCNYETHDITKIKRHLARKNPCIPGEDFSNIDIKTLMTQPMLKNPMDLSELSTEEKRERRLQQKIVISTKTRTCGNMNIEQFSKKIYNDMITSSKKRNHILELSQENILTILENNNIYIVPDTILGDLEFPLVSSNGFHNTSSFDRINDDIGYGRDNIEIRPRFLNNTKKLTTDMIRNIIILRQEKQIQEELENIANNINNFDSDNFFYKLASSIIMNSKAAKKKSKEFGFNGNRECALFLIKKYIEQGGRCIYTNTPIYPETGHLYKISPERLDPTKGYSKDNIVLIVVGLNGAPSGQCSNNHLSEEERNNALKQGIFNQEYWDLCTKITPDIIEKYKEVKDYGKQMLLDNLTDKMKAILGY